MQEDEALLRAAAVIGVSFSADLLAAMAGMDPGDVLDALADIIALPSDPRTDLDALTQHSLTILDGGRLVAG